MSERQIERIELPAPVRRQPQVVEPLLELLVHGRLWDVNGVPVLADDYRTEADKRFVEQSIYFGFDEAGRLDADQRRDFMTMAQAHFTDTCEHMGIEYGGTQ